MRSNVILKNCKIVAFNIKIIFKVVTHLEVYTTHSHTLDPVINTTFNKYPSPILRTKNIFQNHIRDFYTGTVGRNKYPPILRRKNTFFFEGVIIKGSSVPVYTLLNFLF